MKIDVQPNQFNMPILIKNIRGLVGCYETAPQFLRGKAMDHLPVIDRAYLAIDEGRIVDFGSMDEWGGITDWRNLKVIDAEGRYVLPAWCDSHTHIVFPAAREQEFEDRIKGLTYEEIASRGGGILNSAARLAEMSEDELYDVSAIRLHKLMLQGTGAIEIKSGYGLSTEGELKILRVAKRLREISSMCIRTTFLGAHAIPTKYKKEHRKYVDLILQEMLPAVAEEHLADYIDVFCESGYFSAAETLEIVAAGASYGLKAKIHVNQFNALSAIPALVECGVTSVDHLEIMEDEDFAALSGSNTIATALPLCSLFLGIPYTPARDLIERDVIVAIATDFNPGSAPSGNMALAVSLGCIAMGLTPAQSINAATLNGAAAMHLSSEVGCIAIGMRANVLITEPCEHLSYLPYAFGSPAIDGVITHGEVVRLSENLA